MEYEYSWNFDLIFSISLTALAFISMIIPALCICWVYLCTDDDDDDNDDYDNEEVVLPVVVVNNAKRSRIIQLFKKCFFRKHHYDAENQIIIREELKNEKCVICLENLFEIDDESAINQAVVELKKCKHVFHLSCITEWTRVKRTCPMCRFCVHYLYVVNYSGVSTNDRDSVENMV
ncbi:hypothetical protein CsatA_011663 [Cannabis sativa]